MCDDHGDTDLHERPICDGPSARRISPRRFCAENPADNKVIIVRESDSALCVIHNMVKLIYIVECIVASIQLKMFARNSISERRDEMINDSFNMSSGAGNDFVCFRPS
jgi:hypothetical protein